MLSFTSLCEPWGRLSARPKTVEIWIDLHLSTANSSLRRNETNRSGRKISLGFWPSFDRRIASVSAVVLCVNREYHFCFEYLSNTLHITSAECL
jgi:hypothetical protein